MTLLAARSAGVPAFDTVEPDLADPDGFARACEAARRDGFAGKLVIHPDQVAAANRTFMPTADAVAAARTLVAAFAANPQAGALKRNGKMVDRIHLRRAEALLAQAKDALDQ